MTLLRTLASFTNARHLLLMSSTGLRVKITKNTKAFEHSDFHANGRSFKAFSSVLTNVALAAVLFLHIQAVKLKILYLVTHGLVLYSQINPLSPIEDVHLNLSGPTNPK